MKKIGFKPNGKKEKHASGSQIIPLYNRYGKSLSAECQKSMDIHYKGRRDITLETTILAIANGTIATGNKPQADARVYN